VHAEVRNVIDVYV